MKRIGITGNKTVIVEMTPAEWEWLEKARTPTDDDPYKELRRSNMRILNLMSEREGKTVTGIEDEIARIVNESVKRAMADLKLVRLQGKPTFPSVSVGNIE